MSKKQEIFFWNDIDESEWLMSSITKNNDHGFKETIVFPLEIVRVLAFPYLLNKDNDDDGKKEQRRCDEEKPGQCVAHFPYGVCRCQSQYMDGDCPKNTVYE